jgi:hypothetical protein
MRGHRLAIPEKEMMHVSVETEPTAPGTAAANMYVDLHELVEDAFLAAYRAGSFHYLLIVADYIGWCRT